ncbi:MAG: hybrid sensor histidine kinase/response regulator [Leptolyngbyaceae cyanobacterium MAG.088]|nr:hybrid sensor histidine kinase/response regulator [Leptolyngbyaceae cyanobacterium MAG.088]
MTYTPQDFSDFSMLDIFRMEVETQVALLNDNLLAVESQATSPSGADASQLETLMRAAHSIKGAARIVGLELAVKVAHVMEDCFVAAQTSKIRLNTHSIDILLEGVDWYDRLQKIQESELSQWLEQQTAGTTQLVDRIAGILTSSIADQPPLVSTSDGGDLPPSEPVPSSSSPPSAAPSMPLEEASASLPSDISGNALIANGSNHTDPVKQPTHSLNEKDLEAPNGRKSVVQATADFSTNIDTSISVGNAQRDPQAVTADRVVRVSVDNLNRLMALAGESLVEVNWFQPFADAMLHLKQQQQTLARLLTRLQHDANLSLSHQLHLAEAQKTAQDCHALLSERLEDLDQFSRRFSQLSDNLYREVIASHMCPFADGVQGFPRMVRDTAKRLGKQVHLEIVGQKTPVDRDILEKLESPLNHMLSNAIAHGIELPDQRRQLGKPETGKIRLEASHRAGMLHVTVSDDGRGIDLNELRQQVVKKKLTTADMAAQLSDTELMDFLFLPGFSTAQKVTDIAGRGVGLDIAYTMAQELGGLVRGQSKPGHGLTFHFQLPLTLSVIRALLVEIASEPYAFGLNRIDRVLIVNREAVAISENRPYIMVDGENISLASASQVLGLSEAEGTQFEQLSVVVLSNQTHRYGIIVDKFLGERDLVVRPLDPRLGKVQDISAAALTDDGSPLLVIDVADLVCSIEQLVSDNKLSLIPHQTNELTSTVQKQILVVDDSITVREMERKLLQNSGYQVDVAVNGMEGWNTVRSGQYDLVISDIDMPRMNGIELVQQIKSHPQLNQLPVIIVSYKDRQEDQLAGLQAGADYYLTKSSFHDNSLLTAVNDLIGD